MSVPQSPVITPAAGWDNAGRGRLTAPRVTTKPTMWSIINRLAKWDVRYSRFARLSCLRLGGAQSRTDLAQKSFFSAALEKDSRQMRRAKPNKPKGLKTLVINKTARATEKRTQASYEPRYQSLTAILAPILKKSVWIAPPLLRIRGCGPALVAMAKRKEALDALH